MAEWFGAIARQEPRPRRVSDFKKRTILYLRDQGEPVIEIAKTVNLGYSTVRAIIAQYKEG